MKRLLALVLISLLTACASGPQINSSHTSIGQDSRILFLVLHYTVGDFESSLKILTQGEVSSHYLLSDGAEPTIYRLVDENRRAWHAGPSEWRGFTQLNASSIGIEIVNRGYTETPQGRIWEPYPEKQISVLLPLIKDIVKRHQIRPDRIVGHSDILPQWKQDPGPLFPWQRLADEGLIPWPAEERVKQHAATFAIHPPDITWFQNKLATHGFRVPQHGQLDLETRNVLAAFQMKYRPIRFDGEADVETAALLATLTESTR